MSCNTAFSQISQRNQGFKRLIQMDTNRLLWARFSRKKKAFELQNWGGVNKSLFQVFFYFLFPGHTPFVSILLKSFKFITQFSKRALWGMHTFFTQPVFDVSMITQISKYRYFCYTISKSFLYKKYDHGRNSFKRAHDWSCGWFKTKKY